MPAQHRNPHPWTASGTLRSHRQSGATPRPLPPHRADRITPATGYRAGLALQADLDAALDPRKRPSSVRVLGENERREYERELLARRSR